MSDENHRSLDSKLKTALDASSDCFGVFDKDDTVVYCNDSFARAFKYHKGEVIGQTDKELLRKVWDCAQRAVNETFDAWYRKFEALQSECPCTQFETVLCDGRDFKMKRINLESGYILWGVDITALKQMQGSLQKVNKRFKSLINTDQLTGVHNRRAFRTIAHQEFERALRYHHPLTLLLIDVDNINRINKIYGHDAGDRVLREFSKLCKKRLRKTDSLCRIDGEEFAIILPMTDIPAAWVIAERIRNDIETFDFHIKGNEHFNVTVSMGGSSVKGDEESMKEVFRQAGIALHAAKGHGSNRVELSAH